MRIASSDDLGGRFGGEQLGHAGFEIAPLAAILLGGGRVDQQPRRFDPRRHVGQLDLNRLVLRDRLAERVALLRILDRLFERGPRDAQPPRRDVDPLASRPVITCLKPWPSSPPIRFAGRHGEILEVQFAGFDRLVAHLVDVAADGQARRAFFDDERADAPVRRARRGSVLASSREVLRVPAVGDPHLRAVDDVAVAVAARRGRDRLQIGAGVRLRQTDAAARFAAGQPRQEPRASAPRCRTATSTSQSTRCVPRMPASPIQPRDSSSKTIAKVV